MYITFQSIEQSDEERLVVEDDEPWHPTPFRTTPFVNDESSDADLEATVCVDPLIQFTI